MQATLKTITFPNNNRAQMLEAPPYADASEVMGALGFTQPTPAIFISGGASAMSDEEMAKTHALIEDGIARFAADHRIVVIDGGTDTGIMQMMGRARKTYHYRFPLIGCAPAGKVTYPGKADTDATTTLEPNHSHFVLIDGDYWGGESDMIVGLTRSFTHGVLPACGILINGGKIS
ncbi:MAG: hypothetical protein AAF787_08185, partial [Chloroflexota bacterium]